MVMKKDSGPGLPERATYSQKHPKGNMKTRDLVTASGIPLEGQNEYVGPSSSDAGAGRGGKNAGDLPGPNKDLIKRK
jgi:hypothetical protein